MCCKDSCQVIRCPGCPGVDWSAFTWQWTAPASPGFLLPAGGTIKRYFGANDRAMLYPGVCSCLWIVDGNDFGESTDGVLNPIAQAYLIPSIGALQYKRVGTLPQWRITLSRWYHAWSWGIGDGRYYGSGWGWSPSWAGGDCGQGQGYGNPYWGGYGGYGYNGWGWGYGGLGGYGLNYGEYGSVYRVTYSLPDGITMDCSGETVRFFLDDQPTNVDFDPDSWPAYVDIARVQT